MLPRRGLQLLGAAGLFPCAHVLGELSVEAMLLFKKV